MNKRRKLWCPNSEGRKRELSVTRLFRAFAQLPKVCSFELTSADDPAKISEDLMGVACHFPKGRML
jgi:hypothetical protein